jgi:hypothetical protein
MASPQHRNWLNSGGNWRLGEPWRKLRDLLRSKGYTVYDIGNDSHLDRQPPEDHTPYSETGWPGSSPFGVVMALDIMPKTGLPTLQWLGAKFKADKNVGLFPFLKYMNWGPTDDAHAIHSSWQPNYAERASSDTGHIHLSFRTDYVNWSGTYNPWGETMADADYRPYGPPGAESYPGNRTPDTILADIAGEILGGHSPWDGKTPRFLANRLASIEASLNILSGKPVLSEEQFTALVERLAQETDVELIETALRNVLRKGTDNDQS